MRTLELVFDTLCGAAVGGAVGYLLGWVHGERWAWRAAQRWRGGGS
jgi:membrane protein YqaA with SNARE-associated domain